MASREIDLIGPYRRGLAHLRELQRGFDWGDREYPLESLQVLLNFAFEQGWKLEQPPEEGDME